MSNIIIRTAKKDYVCDMCGHIIHKDSEYLDKLILNSNKGYVIHERYHDECPNKKTDVDKVYDILRTGELVPAIYNNAKWDITGIIVVHGLLFFSLLARNPCTDTGITRTVDASSKELSIMFDDNMCW